MANLTTYAIELQYESGREEYVPLLTVITDSQATQQMRAYLSTNARQLLDVNAFLAFYRASDGQRGYLNQDGASPTGKAWSHA